MMYEYEFQIWGTKFYIVSGSLAEARNRLPAMIEEVHGDFIEGATAFQPRSVREIPWMPTPA
jgi:hypothetical protein